MSLKNKLKPIAHAVRDGLRVVRKHSAEYIKATVESVVDQIEIDHPGSGLGDIKLRMAKILLNRILGKANVSDEWEFINDLIVEVVLIRKREKVQG